MRIFGESGQRWQKDTTWGTYSITTVKTYKGPANLKNALIYSDNIYFRKACFKNWRKNINQRTRKNRV